MTTAIDTSTDTEQAVPSWRKADFPDGFNFEISREKAHGLLDDIDGATHETVAVAINDVMGMRYWISREDFDQIQQKLFAEPETPKRNGIGVSLMRHQLMTEGYTQDEISVELSRFLARSEQVGVEDPIITGDEQVELRNLLDARAGVPEGAVARAVKILTLRRQVEELRGVQREFDEFKEKVADVATDYARQHGWCSVIDEALGELGLKRSPDKYTATALIRVSFTATLAERRDLPNADWVRDSIRDRLLTEAIEEGFALDADHDGVEVNDVEIIGVDDVEQVEE